MTYLDERIKNESSTDKAYSYTIDKKFELLERSIETSMQSLKDENTRLEEELEDTKDVFRKFSDK